jgi:hypothetical protein
MSESMILHKCELVANRDTIKSCIVELSREMYGELDNNQPFSEQLRRSDLGPPDRLCDIQL